MTAAIINLFFRLQVLTIFFFACCFYIKYAYVHCAAPIVFALYYDVTVYILYIVLLWQQRIMTAESLRDAFLLLQVGGLGRFVIL